MSKIPEISNRRLKQLYGRIKPVVRFAKDNGSYEQHYDGNLFYIKDVDLRNVAFTWDPTPAKKVEGLEKLCELTTYHSYGYHGFFKPSVAEVISQIPSEYVDDCVAFETTTGVEIAGSYHATITILYKKHREKSERVAKIFEGLIK